MKEEIYAQANFVGTPQLKIISLQKQTMDILFILNETKQIRLGLEDHLNITFTVTLRLKT